MSSRPEIEVAEKYGLTLPTNRTQDPVPGTFPEQQEQERSLYLTPTLRNEEHLFLDIAALLDGNVPEPPKPRVCNRTDDHALFYAGQVNLLFGDPESGKTFSPKPPKLRPSETGAAF